MLSALIVPEQGSDDSPASSEFNRISAGAIRPRKVFQSFWFAVVPQRAPHALKSVSGTGGTPTVAGGTGLQLTLLPNWGSAAARMTSQLSDTIE